MKYVLDICSGLGGWSSAFELDPGYEVITIDIDQRFEPSICMDIKDTAGVITAVKKMHSGKFDLILCSPPCVEFYKVDKPYYPEHYGKKPDMSLVKSCLEIISTFNPPFWCMENSRHGKKWICSLIGNIKHKIGSYYLWGEFPKFNCKVSGKFENDPWSSDPFRAAKRAKIPLNMSQALKDAVENQKTLIDYLEFDGVC